jgi:hypothetical protein
LCASLASADRNRGTRRHSDDGHHHFVDVVDVEFTGHHAAGDDFGDDVGRLVAQRCDRAVVGLRQAVQLVLHDPGLLVVLGVPGGERRNHRAQPFCEARGGVVGSFQRG